MTKSSSPGGHIRQVSDERQTGWEKESRHLTACVSSRSAMGPARCGLHSRDLTELCHERMGLCRLRTEVSVIENTDQYMQRPGGMTTCIMGLLHARVRVDVIARIHLAESFNAELPGVIDRLTNGKIEKYRKKFQSPIRSYGDRKEG